MWEAMFIEILKILNRMKTETKLKVVSIILHDVII